MKPSVKCKRTSNYGLMAKKNFESYFIDYTFNNISECTYFKVTIRNVENSKEHNHLNIYDVQSVQKMIKDKTFKSDFPIVNNCEQKLDLCVVKKMNKCRTNKALSGKIFFENMSTGEIISSDIIRFKKLGVFEKLIVKTFGPHLEDEGTLVIALEKPVCFSPDEFTLSANNIVVREKTGKTAKTTTYLEFDIEEFLKRDIFLLTLQVTTFDKQVEVDLKKICHWFKHIKVKTLEEEHSLDNINLQLPETDFVPYQWNTNNSNFYDQNNNEYITPIESNVDVLDDIIYDDNKIVRRNSLLDCEELFNAIECISNDTNAEGGQSDVHKDVYNKSVQMSNVPLFPENIEIDNVSQFNDTNAEGGQYDVHKDVYNKSVQMSNVPLFSKNIEIDNVPQFSMTVDKANKSGVVNNRTLNQETSYLIPMEHIDQNKMKQLKNFINPTKSYILIPPGHDGSNIK